MHDINVGGISLKLNAVKVKLEDQGYVGEEHGFVLFCFPQGSLFSLITKLCPGN